LEKIQRRGAQPLLYWLSPGTFCPPLESPPAAAGVATGIAEEGLAAAGAALVGGMTGAAPAGGMAGVVAAGMGITWGIGVAAGAPTLVSGMEDLGGGGGGGAMGPVSAGGIGPASVTGKL
jgi:hypothetical protein